MKNPHLSSLETHHAEAQARLSEAQAKLAEAQTELAEATSDEISPQQSRAALDAICEALVKPWPLMLGIVALSPFHAGGLWLALRTRRIMRLAAADDAPPLAHLPRKSDAQSLPALVCLAFVLGLLGALALFSWLQSSGLEELGFVSFYEAYRFVEAYGLSAGLATSVFGWTAVGAMCLLIAGIAAGLYADEWEQAAGVGALATGVSFLLLLIGGLSLGGLLAESGATFGLFVVPALVHGIVNLWAALNRTSLNRTRLQGEYAAWAKGQGTKNAEERDELQTALASAEEEHRIGQQQADDARIAIEAETRRWDSLSRVEQLQELQLVKNIEATETQISTQWITAEAAQREARVAETAARRKAETERQESRFSAQKAAEAARERREAEKAAKQAARPVCRHCGAVEPRMSDNCFRSPTGFHVLMR